MAAHIQGPLYYERTGRAGPVMAFVHPNPMDQSCWMYQMAHFSTWYRCIAIDLPGYGRSPRADAGLRMEDVAAACWESSITNGILGCSRAQRRSARSPSGRIPTSAPTTGR